MNAAEHFICSSSLWRCISQRQILPWVLSGTHLGDHLLEVGAGYGAATSLLKAKVPRVTSLDYDHNSTVKLKSHYDDHLGGVVRGDASHLPFLDHTYSSALAILVLHHLRSPGLQDQMFSEVFRVLRPGGVFVAFDITDGWIHRVGHFRSTFTPVPPASVLPRLTSAGFSNIALDLRRGAFRLTATRPEHRDSPFASVEGSLFTS